MSTNGAKGNLPVLAIDLVKETFVSKCTVISVIVLDSTICLCHDLFKGLDRQIRLVDCVVSHEMDVHKIANMVTESGTSPNAATSEEARHLRNKPWLSRDYLID